MSKQQTAVDYLVEKLIKLGYLHSKNYGQSQVVKKVIEQAKEMEKEQLLDMGNQFAIMGEDNPEQYYNKTYKSE
jgi:hypothetical protein